MRWHGRGERLSWPCIVAMEVSASRVGGSDKSGGNGTSYFRRNRRFQTTVDVGPKTIIPFESISQSLAKGLLDFLLLYTPML